MLTSVTDIIDQLGGPQRVADLVGVKPPAISNAKARGQLPHRWRGALYAEACRLGLTIDPKLIGFESPEAA